MTRILLAAAVGAFVFLGSPVLHLIMTWPTQLYATTMSHAQTSAVAWEGVYATRGDAPNGTYTATTEVIPRGAVFEIRWTFPQGDGMVGVGFVRGAELVVGFAAPYPGVGVYRVIRERPLMIEGQWTSWGFTTIQREEWVKGQAAIRAER